MIVLTDSLVILANKVLPKIPEGIYRADFETDEGATLAFQRTDEDANLWELLGTNDSGNC